MDILQLALQLALNEEQNNDLVSKLNSINTTNAVAPAKQQVEAPSSTGVTINGKQYFTETKENYNTSGLLYQTEYNVMFKLFKVKTPTEFDNLQFIVNNQVFYQGDYEYFKDIELAYFDYESNAYVLNLTNEQFPDGVTVRIDAGIPITLFTVIGWIDKTTTSSASS